MRRENVDTRFFHRFLCNVCEFFQRFRNQNVEIIQK